MNLEISVESLNKIVSDALAMQDLLLECEKLLGRCQAKFPITKDYDSIAQSVSNMRGKITNKLQDMNNADIIEIQINNTAKEMSRLINKANIIGLTAKVKQNSTVNHIDNIVEVELTKKN